MSHTMKFPVTLGYLEVGTPRRSAQIFPDDLIANPLDSCAFIPTSDDEDLGEIFCTGGVDGDVTFFKDPPEEGKDTERYSLQVEEDALNSFGAYDVATINMNRGQVIALAMKMLDAVGIKATGVSFQ